MTVGEWTLVGLIFAFVYLASFIGRLGAFFGGLLGGGDDRSDVAAGSEGAEGAKGEQ